MVWKLKLPHHIFEIKYGIAALSILRNALSSIVGFIGLMDLYLLWVSLEEGHLFFLTLLETYNILVPLNLDVH